MKIAITSQNFRTVTNHAGRARRFLVYSIGEDQQTLEVDRFDLAKDMCIHELKGRDVAHPLDQVDVVLSGSFGPGFARNMSRRNVIASLTEESNPVTAVKEFLEHGQKLPGGDGCGEDHQHGHSH